MRTYRGSVNEILKITDSVVCLDLQGLGVLIGPEVLKL